MLACSGALAACMPGLTLLSMCVVCLAGRCCLDGGMAGVQWKQRFLSLCSLCGTVAMPTCFYLFMFERLHVDACFQVSVD
jgi:hypothetical protein